MKTTILEISSAFHHNKYTRVRVCADWRTQHGYWEAALSDGQKRRLRRWACPSPRVCACGGLDRLTARDTAKEVA